jgi:hypothetical protein
MFLVATTGHGLREIEDEWDYPRLERWIEYCEEHPPVQWMVQAYLGLTERQKPFKVTEENFSDFCRMIAADSNSTVGTIH